MLAGWTFIQYFNLWGLLTFYLYKDNAILFRKGFVASQFFFFFFFFLFVVMGCRGEEVTGSYCTLGRRRRTCRCDVTVLSNAFKS